VALERLAPPGAALPHRWLAGDDEMGRPYGFRRRLEALGEQYVLAVPSHTSIREREGALPEDSGRGRRPQRPWQPVETWSQALDETAWHRIDVCDGRKGPLVVEAVKRRVVARTHRRQQGAPETWVVLRDRDRAQAQVVKVDDSLSHAAPETPLGECARVAKAEHRIEAWLQRSKSEAGLADYEVRHWTGWQPQQTLSFLATWCLVRETERGKKWPPALTLPPIRQGIALILYEVLQCGTRAQRLKECQQRLQRNELARFSHWKQRNLLAPLNLYKRLF